MTDAEKVAAFDNLALALTNVWYDGKVSWWCPTFTGGPMRDTHEEAVADLMAWAERKAKKKRTKPLEVTNASVPGEPGNPATG